MEQVIEVRYAGIVLGQAAGVRERDAAGAFVSVSDPMPVGTILTLTIGDQVTDGRVEQVIESSDPAAAGMRVRFVDNRAASVLKDESSARSAAAAAPSASSAHAAMLAPAAPAEVAGDRDSSSGVPADEGGEGESERIPAPPGLAGFGPPATGGGGRRRRRRR